MADGIPPDLTSVLKSLASFTSQASSSQPNNATRPRPVSKSPLIQTPQVRQAPLISKSGGPIDPTTITTWPAALRYVMLTIGPNEEIQLRLKGISRSHLAQEKKWFERRNALIQTQHARVQKKKELDEVLRSIGAPVDSKETSTAKDNEAEIKRFDLQVHSACADLEKALEAELRGFKIPFFVLRSSLIRDESSANAKSEEVPKLSKSELVDLKRRMLGLLNDLCCKDVE